MLCWHQQEDSLYWISEGRDGGTHVSSLISSLSQAKHRVLSTPGESSHNSLGDRQSTHLVEKVVDQMPQLGSLVYKLDRNEVLLIAWDTNSTD